LTVVRMTKEEIVSEYLDTERGRNALFRKDGQLSGTEQELYFACHDKYERVSATAKSTS